MAARVDNTILGFMQNQYGCPDDTSTADVTMAIESECAEQDIMSAYLRLKDDGGDFEVDRQKNVTSQIYQRNSKLRDDNIPLPIYVSSDFVLVTKLMTHKAKRESDVRKIIREEMKSLHSSLQEIAEKTARLERLDKAKEKQIQLLKKNIPPPPPEKKSEDFQPAGYAEVHHTDASRKNPESVPARSFSDVVAAPANNSRETVVFGDDMGSLAKSAGQDFIALSDDEEDFRFPPRRRTFSWTNNCWSR